MSNLYQLYNIWQPCVVSNSAIGCIKKQVDKPNDELHNMASTNRLVSYKCIAKSWTLYISEYNYFDVIYQVRSKVGNVSNFKSVGPGLNNTEEIWRNEKCIQKVD